MKKHTKSIGRRKRPNGSRPTKPYPEFPLFAHARGYWAKKIRGRVIYFGRWDDPVGALQKFVDQRDALFAGREPRPVSDALTVRDLVNRFLTAKQNRVETGELSRKTWVDYHATAGRVVRLFGADRRADDLLPQDFAMLRKEFARTRGPTSLGNEIQRVRAMFKYAYEAGLLDKPMRFGPEFAKPSMRAQRLARQAKGPRMFAPAEIRAILGAASVPMRAIVLLGINCGWGNSDIANVPVDAFDLERGVVDFPRPKTAIERRATLWPETIEAIREYLRERPRPAEASDKDILFITKYGRRWTRMNSSGAWVDGVAQEFGKLTRALEINRPGATFYTLRHCFESIAGETRDQPAVDRIMGHEADNMATRYREWRRDRREDERLRVVTDHVRAWLFGAGGASWAG